MLADKKKYRLMALVLPVLLAISFIVPSALFAVNYFCEANPGSEVNTAGTVADCCSEPGLTESSDEQEQVDYCTFEQVCKNSISDLFLEFQTILPAETNVYAASVTFPFLNPVPDNNTFSYISPDSPIFFSTPPIFLLNSVFLN